MALLGIIPLSIPVVSSQVLFVIQMFWESNILQKLIMILKAFERFHKGTEEETAFVSREGRLFFIDVSVQSAIIKSHRLGSPSNKTFLSQSSRGWEIQASRCRYIRCLLRAHIMVLEVACLFSLFLHTWWKEGEREVLSLPLPYTNLLGTAVSLQPNLTSSNLI